ncbi:MAG: hypothetical protein AAF518_00575 [Spirochaetota bacterium]
MSHSIVLTKTGFRVISSEFQTDIFSSLLVFGVLSFALALNLHLLPYILLVLGTSLAIFLYYKKRIGYIYPLAFFYQVMLFLLAVPIVFLQWFPLVIAFLSLFACFSKSNPFRDSTLPIGIFLLALVSSLALLANAYNSGLNLFIGNYTNPLGINNPNISGIFFSPIFSMTVPYAASSYSILENLGMYSIFFLGFAILREDNFWIEFILIASFFAISSLNSRFDFALVYQQNLITTVIWYLFHSAPGRSYNANYSLSIFALIGTLGGSVLLVSLIGSFPPILNIFFYFFSRAVGFFVMQNLVRKNPMYS